MFVGCAQSERGKHKDVGGCTMAIATSGRNNSGNKKQNVRENMEDIASALVCQLEISRLLGDKFEEGNARAMLSNSASRILGKTREEECVYTQPIGSRERMHCDVVLSKGKNTWTHAFEIKMAHEQAPSSLNLHKDILRLALMKSDRSEVAHRFFMMAGSTDSGWYRYLSGLGNSSWAKSGRSILSLDKEKRIPEPENDKMVSQLKAAAKALGVDELPSKFKIENLAKVESPSGKHFCAIWRVSGVQGTKSVRLSELLPGVEGTRRKPAVAPRVKKAA